MKQDRVRKMKAEQEKSEQDPSKQGRFDLDDGAEENSGLQDELIGLVSTRKTKTPKEKKGKGT